MPENDQPETGPFGVTPAQEAAVDARIASIMGGAADDDDEMDEGEEPDSEPAPAPTAPAESTPADAELEKARARLQLAGTPAKSYAGLDREETLEWASRLASRESDINRALRERADLEKRLADIEATKSAEHGVPTAQPDLAALRTKLADQFGESEAEALIGTMESLVAARAPEVAALQEQLRASNAIVEEILSERLRGGLGARDPRLSDPNVFLRVQQRAQKLSADPSYSDLSGIKRAERLMADAALLELGPAPQQDAGTDAADVRSGTPTRPRRATTGPTPSTYNEVVDAKIRDVMRGATTETLKRKYGG